MKRKIRILLGLASFVLLACICAGGGTQTIIVVQATPIPPTSTPTLVPTPTSTPVYEFVTTSFECNNSTHASYVMTTVGVPVIDCGESKLVVDLFWIWPGPTVNLPNGWEIKWELWTNWGHVVDVNAPFYWMDGTLVEFLCYSGETLMNGNGDFFEVAIPAQIQCTSGTMVLDISVADEDDPFWKP